MKYFTNENDVRKILIELKNIVEDIENINIYFENSKDNNNEESLEVLIAYNNFIKEFINLLIEEKFENFKNINEFIISNEEEVLLNTIELNLKIFSSIDLKNYEALEKTLEEIDKWIV